MKSFLLITLSAIALTSCNTKQKVSSKQKIQWLSLSEVEEKMRLNPKKVLIDIYTDWCGPCRMLTPVLETVAEDNGIAAVKINIDDAPDIVKKYSVRSIPRILFIKDGVVIDDLHGLQKKQNLESVCQKVYGV
mgnify:CR=1 FL=1